MENETKKDIVKRLSALNKELSVVKKEMQAHKQEKQKAFTAKNKISQQIRDLIREVKGSKAQRDEVNKLIKGSKEKRASLNTGVKKKLGELKKLHQEKRDIIKKHNIKSDPSKVKKEIEDLEFKSETEVLSPGEEKRLNAVIKEKKKQYEECKKVSEVFDRINTASNELRKLQMKADDAHKKVRERAEKGKGKHEEFIDTSRTIDKLKKEEKKAIDELEKIKKVLKEAYEKAKPKFDEVAKLKDQLAEINMTQAQKKKKADSKKLEEKKKEVKQKISKRKKLTNEDLITMQG